ncbi:MAG: lipoprotein-releasing ABC transporter ATP-binding protein LolD [Neisseriales bacterium]|nr:MAG: lipoprotein-releasing ABC transporter ATP-binding protein LolD [Neisseriales bacterium]
MNKTVLHCSNLSKNYGRGATYVEVFAKVALSVASGECVAITGPSGSGKSTLLHLLGGLDRPSCGEVWVDQTALSTLSEKAIGYLRNRMLGFIYQFHHLLPELTALENTAMPLLIRRITWQEAETRAHAILEKVGLQHRIQHKPSALSGGERQRVAIARAMVTEPLCILADEPTGNLDYDNARHIIDLLLSLNERTNTSIIVATHDKQLAKRMQRIYQLEKGHLTLRHSSLCKAGD